MPRQSLRVSTRSPSRNTRPQPSPLSTSTDRLPVVSVTFASLSAIVTRGALAPGIGTCRRGASEAA